jgi:4-hydroxy-2-oxoheptanedioate aldolase
MNPRRTLRERLSTRRALIGLLQVQSNPPLAEMAGWCGYDFLLLDCEHGVFSDRDILHTLQALRAADTLALVRLAKHDLQAVGRYLDLGADAIVVPNVSTVEQAQALASAMNYPPAGTRGFAAPLQRATRYGLDLAAHAKAPRDEVCLIVIVESALGVANVGDILAVDGVDGVIIGPADLSADLGCPGDYSPPAYAQALARVERAAKENDKLLGTAPHPGSPIETLLMRGHQLIVAGADLSLIREALSAHVAKAKACL